MFSPCIKRFSGKVNGFRGSHGADGSDFDAGNLAQSYSALLCLAILGDDFGRVDRDALLKTVRESQRENGSLSVEKKMNILSDRGSRLIIDNATDKTIGVREFAVKWSQSISSTTARLGMKSFWSQGEGSESDMRFVYCAVAICEMLQDRSSIDWTRLSQFIRNSYNPDGGISQGPGDESHGGSTYCAIASLELANRLWDESVLNAKQLERLGRWAVFKQEEGFHGRSHKDDDTCYAFWIGATLKILNMDHYIDRDSLKSFQLKCQHSHIGGFSKINEVGAFPDILHTYFTIASMGVMGEPMVRSVYAPLNTARRTYDYIKKLSFTS